MTGSPTSVVVATHERSSSLLRTLHQLSLLPETPPVIVVDNGSADGTAALVRERTGPSPEPACATVTPLEHPSG